MGVSSSSANLPFHTDSEVLEPGSHDLSIVRLDTNDTGSWGQVLTTSESRDSGLWKQNFKAVVPSKSIYVLQG